MHKVYFLCIVCGMMFCATSTLAQLSANPWVDANTKEQIDEVYKKYLDDEFLASVRALALDKYQIFTDKNKDTREFTPVSLEFLNKNI